LTITLERIDSVPLQSDNFSTEFSSWLSILCDSLNEVIQQLEDYINLPFAPSLTTVQITALPTTTPNGTLVYDSTTNQLKAKVNGVIVVLA
jgi:hypothetical protein